MTQPIYPGSPVRVYGTFTDPTSNGAPVDVLDALWPGSGSGNTLVDPTAVTVSLLRSDGSAFASAAAATRKSQGRYYYDFTVDRSSGHADVPQIWQGRMVGTGANPGVIEFTVSVTPSPFVP